MVQHENLNPYCAAATSWNSSLNVHLCRLYELATCMSFQHNNYKDVKGYILYSTVFWVQCSRACLAVYYEANESTVLS